MKEEENTIQKETSTEETATEITPETTPEKTETTETKPEQEQTEAAKEQPEGETTTTGQLNDPEDVDVLFVDPSPVTTYKTEYYEIDIVHSLTLGDVLISTLLCMLIIVMVLSRLVGRYR